MKTFKTLKNMIFSGKFLLGFFAFPVITFLFLTISSHVQCYGAERMSNGLYVKNAYTLTENNLCYDKVYDGSPAAYFLFSAFSDLLDRPQVVEDADKDTFFSATGYNFDYDKNSIYIDGEKVMAIKNAVGMVNEFEYFCSQEGSVDEKMDTQEEEHMRAFCENIQEWHDDWSKNKGSYSYNAYR